LDADSEGEEGKFYVWSKEEIKQILGSGAEIFCDYFGITDKGNWEPGKNIPDINMGDKNIEKKYNLTQDELLKKINSLKDIVFKEREKRIRPHTDDKILTSWNALMAKGLLDAYKTFGEKSFLDLAQKNIDFLLKNIVTKDSGLYRNYKNGNATIPAFLDDYAFMISTLIDYYEVTFNENYLQKANRLRIC
ncbi:MAG: thioredoxin domain-containing protein, partial [Ginsengibacter sp.]